MTWLRNRRVWAGLLGFTIIGLLAWFFIELEHGSERPIQTVKLTSELQQISMQEVNQVLQTYVGSSFWKVELNKIQSDLTRLDWVSQAVVKRSWPDQLTITIEEQTPVARWGDTGLVNHKGEVFFPSSITGFENYVRLEGRLESATQVLTELGEFQSILNGLNWSIEQLAESVDGGWQIDVLDGPRLLLAKEGNKTQLVRFVRSYEQLKEASRNSAQVYDLRYSNGFSVKRISGQ